MRSVARDEVLAQADKAKAGPGTYVDGDVIRALFEGTFTADEDGTCRVQRERKPLPRARRRRGERGAEDDAIGGANVSRGAATHRHGIGKHGRPVGKPKKGFGDQGAWD